MFFNFVIGRCLTIGILTERETVCVGIDCANRVTKYRHCTLNVASVTMTMAEGREEMMSISKIARVDNETFGY